MVVEEGLGDVEQLAPIASNLAEVVEQVLKVARVGFVRTDLLGGEDQIELHPQLRLRQSEGGTVDVGENDQLIALGQPLEGIG